MPLGERGLHALYGHPRASPLVICHPIDALQAPGDRAHDIEVTDVGSNDGPGVRAHNRQSSAATDINDLFVVAKQEVGEGVLAGFLDIGGIWFFLERGQDVGVGPVLALAAGRAIKNKI